ncbi:hypothetical protein [Enterovirga rhinocerotis]|uniref:hypothetical protein n=1 Tax=Enterovirga rhinocerotis TaxID=1339210 RepID=UPI0010615E1B|nr:hypothetical protein [Enterovirga rhinocerotis]
MKNDDIKSLLARIEQGEPLTKEEQLLVLRDLLRANQRIEASRQAGYTDDEPPRQAIHDQFTPL